MARTAMPSSVEALQALVTQQQAMIEERDALIAILEEWKRLAQSQRFGRKSERFADDAQARLFDEAEVTVAHEDDTESEDVSVPAHTRKKRRPRALPDFLPVQEVLHDLSEEEKVCPHDESHRLVEIGREISDQLQFIPATIEVIRHVRPRYACSHCKRGVRIAPMPKLPVPKSIATPSLLAQVATSKYVDGLPLYRQEKIFARLGLDLSRATLAHWMVKMGELVEPLVEEIRKEVRAGGFVQCDETPFQVLKEPGKAAQSPSYLWALRGGPLAHPLLYYEYDPSRSGEVPKRLLRGFEGFLQTDGYQGYAAIGDEPGVVHVGCWAHARRKFDEALRGQKSKKGRTKPVGQAEQGAAGPGADPRPLQDRARAQRGFARGAPSRASGSLEARDRQATPVARRSPRHRPAAEPYRQGHGLSRRAVATARPRARRWPRPARHQSRRERDPAPSWSAARTGCSPTPRRAHVPARISTA